MYDSFDKNIHGLGLREFWELVLQILRLLDIQPLTMVTSTISNRERSS